MTSVNILSDESENLVLTMPPLALLYEKPKCESRTEGSVCVWGGGGEVIELHDKSQDSNSGD